ncbi:general transcription factor 3C polypeptide 1 [Ixodes scapularis]|uniref:general transcription factor 3C polypeptide 1 n=1 Tax=Ixodes scapularis TaxID=6945 RepID=UPI001A9FB894|nr:general transcription factor 3C polypeptide 1 [Ixodes scapularis]
MADNDFYAACIEEIALEGLDGITLQALWIRLKDRPKFPFALDDKSKAFIWRSIVPDARLDFYRLQEPRQELVLYDRYKHVDPDSGYVIEPKVLPPDLYPVELVNKNGQRGSCSTFDSRVNVSEKVRKAKLTLEAVVKQWGNSLVIVADQATRERALIGPCNSVKDLDLSDVKYAVLERIGRTRYAGLTTQGKQDMKVFQLTNASMFLLRKQLVQRHLITKQLYYQRSDHKQSGTGFLLHLPRFFVEVQTKFKMLTRELCALLDTKPLKREVLRKVRAEMGLKNAVFKRLINSAAVPYVTQYTMAYNELYPDTPEKQWYTKNTGMKLLRVIELTKSFEEEEAEGAEGDDDGEEMESQSSIAMFYDPRKYIYDLPRLDQAYRELQRAGTKGATLRELAQLMSTTRLEARPLLKALLFRKLVVPYREDVGRQRVTRYFTPEFASQSETHKKFAAEKKRMLEQASKCPPAKRQRVSQRTDISEVKPPASENAPMKQGTGDEVPSEECDQPTITVEASNEPLSKKIKTKGCTVLSFPSTSGIINKRQSLQELLPSYKMLMRANRIIDYVKAEKLVADLTRLLKTLQKQELEEGYKLKLDKVSLERLLYKLCKSGYLKSIRTTLRLGEKEKNLQFICHPDVTKDDELVRSTIEQAKFKYFAIHNENNKPQAPKSPELTECSKMEYNPSMGRFYGSQPKFRRMQLCYSFIHYMLYTYDGAPLGHLDDDPSAPMRYQEGISWKTFVAPLPANPSTPKGWLLFSDILLSLPLSLFVKIVSCIKYKIEGLDEYLQHNVRCHYLIRSLPVKLRNALLFARRYIYSIHETIKRLSFVGLLTFGPQRLKEKDQVYLFLHKRITIKDTACSAPGYHQISPDTEYPLKDYFLETEEDVNRFWFDLEGICLSTPLGTAQTMRGQVIELQNLYKKPAMIEASKNREFGEEVDTGSIPGDQLGAAGFDSALFAHLKRNWNYTTTVVLKTPGLMTVSQKEKSKPLENYIEYLDKTGKETDGGTARKQKQKQRLSRLRSTISRMSVYYPKPGAPSTDPVAIPVVINGSRERSKASEEAKKRTLFRRKPHSIFRVLKRCGRAKKRRPYYDDKDMAALKQMRFMRVAWSSQEDIVLLMCKVASWFLDPHQPKMVVPFTAVRDILHEHFPELSKDKTSRACQRRLRFMLLNPATKANASVFLCEARQDQKLTEMFYGPKPVKSAEDAWIHMLRTVLDHLMIKFSKSPQERHRAIALPKTVEELKDQYNILVSGQCLPDSWSYQEPHNIVDIHFTTVGIIIISSFGADDGKTSWSLILYRIYELYPDKLIRSVTARLRHNSVICRKKCHAKKQFSSLNMSMLPFTLSGRFQFELMRRFAPENFVNMAQLLTTLFKNQTSGEKFTTVDAVDPPHAVLLITLIMMKKVDYVIDVPQAIVDFDSKVCEDNGNPCKVVTKGPPSESPLAGSCSYSDSLSNLHIETSGSNAKASRSFLYMLRQDMTKALEFTSLRPQDYVIIKPCKISFGLSDGDVLARCTVEEPTDKSYKLKIRSPVYDKLVQEQREVLAANACELLWTAEDISKAYADHGKNDAEANFAHGLYALIVDRKELGITFTTLCETFHLNVTSAVLESHLDVLVSCKAIVRAGVTCVRYIALLHAKPWMVRAVKIPKDLRSLATALGEQELARKAKARKTSSSAEDEAMEEPSAVDTSPMVVDENTAEVSPMSVDESPAGVSAMEVDDSTADNCDLSTYAKSPADEVKSSDFVNTMQKPDNGEASVLKVKDDPNSAVTVTEPKKTQQTSPGQRPATRGAVFNRTCIEAMSRNINMEKLEKIMYIPRLWKKPDGTLNRALLHKYMSAVLSFVMDNPGITEESMRTSFAKHIGPCIQTLDVLRMLEEIGCIKRFYFRSGTSKCTLFSERRTAVFSEVYEVNDDVCFEGTMEALLNFAAFTSYFLK